MSKISTESAFEPVSWDEALLLFPELSSADQPHGAYGLDANGDLWCIEPRVKITAGKATLIAYRWDGTEWRYDE